MRKYKFTSKFKKDLKLQKKRGKTPEKLRYVMEEICLNGDAPLDCKPHNLKGKWSGYRECHIEPDWLLIYVVYEEIIIFYRTGSHPDLFE